MTPRPDGPAGDPDRDRHRDRMRSRRSAFALPAVVVATLVAAGALSTAVASLALVALAPGWSVLLFYTLPALFFVAWSVRYLTPSLWRRMVFPIAWRGRRIAGTVAPRAGAPSPARALPRSAPPPEPEPAGHLSGEARLADIEERAIRPWLITMRAVLAAWRTPRARMVVNVVFGVAALALTGLAAGHFAQAGWPLAGVNENQAAAAGALMLLTFAFKAIAWGRIFQPRERPPSLSLATATGVAAVGGIALPGRFDDALRISVVRKLAPSRAGIGTIALSLFVLGLLDTAAMTPFAAVAAVSSGVATPVKIAFGIVAGAGLGAGLLAAGLPRIAADGRLGRFRLARWLARHSPASGRDALVAGLLVLGAWLARTAGLVVLLSAFGLGVSFPLAAGYLAAAAASAALPVSPAGAATQAGVGAAVLATAGLSATHSIAFSVAAQMITIMAGALVAVFAVLLQAASRRGRWRPA